MSDFGQREEALAASEEAVELYREVASRHADVFMPEFASALYNLSNRLSDFDRPEEALAASEEARTRTTRKRNAATARLAKKETRRDRLIRPDLPHPRPPPDG